MSPQMDVYPTYTMAVEAARLVEYGEKEKGTEMKKCKHDSGGKNVSPSRSVGDSKPLTSKLV